MGRRTLRKPVTRRSMRPSMRPSAPPDMPAATLPSHAPSRKPSTLPPPPLAPAEEVAASHARSLAPSIGSSAPIAAEPQAFAPANSLPSIPPLGPGINSTDDMAQAQPTAEKTPTVTQSAEPRNRAIANLPSVIVEGALAATSAHPASHTNLHHEDAFFSTAPAAADHDEDIFELPMSRAPRRAVTGVVVMLTASAVLTAAFVAYYESSKSASKTTQTQVVDTSSDSPAEKPVDEATAQPQAPVDEPSPTPSAAAADEIPSKDFAANEVVEAEVEPTDVPEVDQARTSAEQSAYDGLVATGVAKQRKGKRKEALAAYEAALALAPGASEVLGKIALMHLESNQMKPAQEYAEKAVAADANNAEGWIVLGAAKQTRGDAKGAREAYQQCANLPDPRYATECRRMAR